MTLPLALLAVVLAAEPAERPASYPLVLLGQGDAAGDGFRLRRLRVGEDVRAGDFRVRAVAEMQGTADTWAGLQGGRLPTGGPVRLTDAFVAWIPHRAFEIDVGSQRVPFSLSRQVDEADLRLPERAAVVDAGVPDFRAGVALAHDMGLIQARAALLSADTTLDGALFDSGALFALRIGTDPIGPMGVAPWRRPSDDVWAPWWRYSLAASFLYGTLFGPGTAGVGGDGQLQWERLTVTAEYFLLRVREPAPQRSAFQHGAVVEPGVALWRDRLDFVLRGSWSHWDGVDAVGAGAGLTLLTHHAHLRWQAGLERRWNVDGAASGWAIARLAFVL
jgi:hypothetical protein